MRLISSATDAQRENRSFCIFDIHLNIEEVKDKTEAEIYALFII